MREHEVQIMAKGNDGTMVLIDRCRINADDCVDAARRYAQLFGDGRGLPIANLADNVDPNKDADN